jgi:hypothetical protein
VLRSEPKTAVTPAPQLRRDESQLVISNPSKWGVPIHFAIDEEIYTLNPGESRQVDAVNFPRIRFHRGEDFGDAEYLIGGGDYEFRVTDNGWALVEPKST